MLTLPRLPYLEDALEPSISALTVSFHYGKHTRAYIDNFNRLCADTEYESLPLEEVICKAPAGPLFNNASQAWNHLFYFFQFSGTPKHLPGVETMEAITNSFGSYEDFRKAFEAEGTALFGSGWVWLCADDFDNLVIVSTSNADNPMTEGLTPLLVADVWEHAYYLDYQNRRADYLKRFWDILDWTVIDQRLELLANIDNAEEDDCG